MNNVSLQIPASLSDFSAVQDGRTTAKLKMFYVGETADGRVFTEEFANQLVKSLPYCPVVGFFSDIQDDFLGHNSKQYIYGFVRPDAEYGFEEEDGKKWLVTEVMLYTDRPDNTGEVARKIVGQPHSLELNPNNVKYEVFSEGGKRKIKFTEGSLIGLSVLGTNQKPAFTGSEFFMESDLNGVRERFDSFFSFLEDNSRGEQMENKEQFESYVKFVKLTYNDKMQHASEILQEQLGDNFACFIEDMDDSSFIAGQFSFETGKLSYVKYDYALNEAEFTLDNPRSAFKKFLTVEEMNYLESFKAVPPVEEDEDEEEKKEEGTTKAEEIVEEAIENAEVQDLAAQDDDKKEDSPEDSPEEDEDEDEKDQMAASDEEEKEEEEKKEEDVAKAQEQDDKKENEKEEEDESSKEDEDDKKEILQHTSALSDSERQELEEFRKQAKQRLIVSYEGMLSKEVLDTFANKINDYEFDELEAKLAIEFSKYSRENKTNSREIPLSFGNLHTAEEATVDNYASLVKRVLNK